MADAFSFSGCLISKGKGFRSVSAVPSLEGGDYSKHDLMKTRFLDVAGKVRILAIQSSTLQPSFLLSGLSPPQIIVTFLAVSNDTILTISADF